MTAKQLREWQLYDELEPFGKERDSYLAASICQALWNIARDTAKYPEGWPLDDFLVYFGDDIPLKKASPKQTVQQQELLLDTWILGNNLSRRAAAREKPKLVTVAERRKVRQELERNAKKAKAN